ncbi:hypothetical protein N9N85_01125 [Schleiferiaceae bacterium]|jgi:hypothetical protein|nr:hypothetical protein [Schleiferiaceae bacterium]
MRSPLGLLCILLLTLPVQHACTQRESHTDYTVQLEANTPSFSNYIIHTLTDEQEIALDAMDRLQVDMLEPARLYSTFPGIQHSATPPDTQLNISASVFKKAVQLFVKKYKTQTLTPDEQDSIISVLSKADENYFVSVYSFQQGYLKLENDSLPAGTWIFSRLLQQRDFVLHW